MSNVKDDFRFQRFEMRFKPITHIHIGSGNEIDPFKYVIKNKKIYYLNELSFFRYLASEKKEQFNKVLESCITENIQKFIRDNFLEKPEFYTACYSVDAKFEEFYWEKFFSKDNQQIVYEFIKNGFNQPFIPGSSIKGAIRTALVHDRIDVKDNLVEEKSDVLEARKFGYTYKNREGIEKIDITNDPFKFLKPADINFDASLLNVKLFENTKIKTADPATKSVYSYEDSRIAKKKSFSEEERKSVIPWYAEVLDCGKAVTSLNSTIDIAEGFPFSSEAVIELVNKYYRARFEKEKIPLSSLSSSNVQKLEKEFNEKKGGVMILKLGKTSGQNYLSVNDNIKMPTTRNIVDKQFAGWCKIQIRPITN